jgi:hypothetical protein
MFAGVIVLESVLILVLLWTLLAGQPAAQAQQLAQIDSQATRIALLTAALPTPAIRGGCPV